MVGPVSAAGAVFALLASVPMTYGATWRLHERWRARWRLRGYADLDADPREYTRVRATGIVRALDDTLIAPLSGRECVAYRSRVRSAGRDHAFVPRESMQIRPFVIDLGDEEIVVDGERAIFGLPPVKLVPRNAMREEIFRARHALPGGAGFTEVALELGARVAVGGTLVFVPRDEPADHELGFRDPPPLSQRIVGSREHPLVFVGLDGDDPAA